jgi:hypothetical protein
MPNNNKIKTGREAREEREKMLLLKHKYMNRITVARFANESLKNGDYANAITKYVDYLQVMCDVKNVEGGIYNLRPKNFDAKKDVSEMLMISHIYFELAQVYDLIPKYVEDCRKCLEQFSNFSSNQPYQVLNSELIRKHLKKSNIRNPELFKTAHGQIYIQSKKCYIVTFCYGTNHPLTAQYREFKDYLLEFHVGQELVRCYYKLSSEKVPSWENKKYMHTFAKLTIKPLLLIVSKTLLRFILR